MADRHQLILELIPRLRRFAHAVCGDTDAGDDAVNSALVEAMHRPISSRDQERLFRGLLSAIYSGLEPQKSLAAVKPVAAIAMADSSKVADLLTSLSVPERAALILATTEALAYRSIAEIMGIGEPSVRAHLTRAREKLRVGLIDQIEAEANGEGHVRAASP